MEIFAVPQREVRVRLFLQDGRDLEGITFVPAFGPDGGPGCLFDRLNDEPEDFFALKEGHRTHLVQEEHILMIRVEDDEVEEEVRGRITGSQQSRNLLVKIHLVSGTEIIGELAYVLPAERERLQDYLNSAKRFIPLRNQKQLFYVNCHQIISVLSLRGE